jgi:hypothetical protein
MLLPNENSIKLIEERDGVGKQEIWCLSGACARVQ